jgi:hypothetical protein
MDELDPRRLVFVDEMGTHTSLAPVYAYGTIGERAFFKVPRNRGRNTTLVASLHFEGMGPSMAVEGATTREVFEVYVDRALSGTRSPARSDSGDGQPGSTQTTEGERADRRERLRVALPAALFPGAQPDRGSLLEGQEHPTQVRGPNERDACGSHGRGTGCG